MLSSLVENEDDKEFRNDICIYLLEKFFLFRTLSKNCSQTQAEEEFQKAFCCALRNADKSLKEYLKQVYPELCEIFVNQPAPIEYDDSFDEAECAAYM